MDAITTQPASKRISGSRIPVLECIRGYSALVVVLWHLSLGFFPGASGIFSGFDQKNSLKGSVLYGFFNGSAAVIMFFLLSAFVLTTKAFQSGDAGLLLRNAIKRWPRLAFLITLVVLCSWCLFELDLYRFAEAAALTGSPWLAAFQYAPEIPFDRPFADALRQGLYGALFENGQYYYDTALWTMRYEFYGSFLAFGLAAVLLLATRWWMSLALVAVAVVACLATGDPWWTPFPLGVALARFQTSHAWLDGPYAAPFAAVVALWMFGYTGNASGVQIPLAYLFGQLNSIYVWTLGATLLLFTVMNSTQPPGWLDRPTGRFLGWISFALYLVHGLVICSAGSASYIFLIGAGAGHAAAALVASVGTLLISVIISIPLSALNDQWVKGLNFALEKVLPRKTTRAMGEPLSPRHTPEI